VPACGPRMQPPKHNNTQPLRMTCPARHLPTALTEQGGGCFRGTSTTQKLRPPTLKINRTQLVLFGMRNRTFGPYLGDQGPPRLLVLAEPLARLVAHLGEQLGADAARVLLELADAVARRRAALLLRAPLCVLGAPLLSGSRQEAAEQVGRSDRQTDRWTDERTEVFERV
jgi:hypothetical protein